MNDYARLHDRGLLAGQESSTAWAEAARHYGKTIDTLTADRDRLAAQVEAVKALHVPFEWLFGEGPVFSCQHCRDQGADEAHAQWPCPTIRALEGES